MTVWILSPKYGQTDSNPACVNTTVTFANTMTTAASGYKYWVRLDWRDAAGQQRGGGLQVGPFDAPTVTARKLATAPLHACAPSTAPTGMHATFSVIIGPEGPEIQIP